MELVPAISVSDADVVGATRHHVGIQAGLTTSPACIADMTNSRLAEPHDLLTYGLSTNTHLYSKQMIFYLSSMSNL